MLVEHSPSPFSGVHQEPEGYLTLYSDIVALIVLEHQTHMTNLINALPAAAKDAVYRRMWQILSGSEPYARYARLSLVNREAIVQILRDTKPDVRRHYDSRAA